MRGGPDVLQKEIEPRFFGRPAYSLVIMLTALSQLHTVNEISWWPLLARRLPTGVYIISEIGWAGIA
jgi:hypothetical protein